MQNPSEKIIVHRSMVDIVGAPPKQVPPTPSYGEYWLLTVYRWCFYLGKISFLQTGAASKNGVSASSQGGWQTMTN